jgi:hypothetical protein
MAETKNDALAAFDDFVETWGVKYDRACPTMWSRGPGEDIKVTTLTGPPQNAVPLQKSGGRPMGNVVICSVRLLLPPMSTSAYWYHLQLLCLGMLFFWTINRNCSMIVPLG